MSEENEIKEPFTIPGKERSLIKKEINTYQAWEIVFCDLKTKSY